MMRRFSWFPILAGLVVLAGCPDDPYNAETWTKKLKDDRELDRAVQELEQLGNPSAIPALGDAWVDKGKPVRLLQVIISLARPLSPQEAKTNYFTDYEVAGRPASWERALPYLKRALSEVDEVNARSVDSAAKAADALGESRLPDGLDVLIELAQKPVTKKLINAQIAALRAIGKYTSDSQRASAALIKLIDKDPPASPRTAEKDQMRAAEEKYSLFLGFTGAAVNALGNLHVGAAAKTLVLAMFRTPELFTLIRRALVASGPAAFDELRKVLAGTHPEVNQLFKDKRLDRYCGDRNNLPPDQCQPVSAMVFFPAVVLGDFYDARAVPELLAALQRPALPVFYIDDQPSPNTQYNAIFDALRKIGAPEGAATVRAMWMGHAPAAAPRAARGSKRGAGPAAGGAAEPDLTTRVLAISTYPFLARDDAGVDELGKIAVDNGADPGLRQAAAASFALLAHDPKDIALLEGQVQKFLTASAENRAKADGKPKAVAEAADKEFAKAKKLYDDAKARVDRVSHDKTKTAADIRDATDAASKAGEAFKAARKAHDDAVVPFREADALAKARKSFARLFQSHIARIQIAITCKQDITCYAGTLQLQPADALKANAAHIKDWKKDDKDDDPLLLIEASVERAMLEIGKRGTKASALTDKLLDSAKSDNRLIRQSVLLALPKIAAVPCANCEAKLQAAIRAGEGKTTLGDLNLETTMMKNYFGWAGGKTPSSAPAEKDDLPAPSAPAAPPRKK